ncbi:hypothetical protein [Ureibacillus sp. FSL K6-2830]
MLLNQILSRENMLQALKRVEQNKGSHGEELLAYFKKSNITQNPW